MSTTDSEDPETEIYFPPPEVEPAQISDPEINQELDCIFPFIDLETAGNGQDDWEVFNVLCGVTNTNQKAQVNFGDFLREEEF